MFTVQLPDQQAAATALTCCRRLLASSKPLPPYQRQSVAAVIELLQQLSGATFLDLDDDKTRALRMAVFSQRDTLDLHFAADVQRLARQLPDPLTLPWWRRPDEQILQFISIGTSRQTARGNRPTFMIAIPDRETFEVALAEHIGCVVGFDGAHAAAVLGELWDDVAEVSVGLAAAAGHPHLLKVTFTLPQTTEQRNSPGAHPNGRLTHEELSQLTLRIHAAAAACGVRPTTLHFKRHVGMLPVDWPASVELHWTT
ncbi:hypothetical protein AB0B66_10450 [Catellatospora sp. NPDC049111]|uniref:hypothetical protein n=1 Tax=Catellatospora sp. NPDC049111 TaxID=3155271 RepID=UPI0033EF801A